MSAGPRRSTIPGRVTSSFPISSVIFYGLGAGLVGVTMYVRTYTVTLPFARPHLLSPYDKNPPFHPTNSLTTIQIQDDPSRKVRTTPHLPTQLLRASAHPRAAHLGAGLDRHGALGPQHGDALRTRRRGGRDPGADEL